MSTQPIPRLYGPSTAGTPFTAINQVYDATQVSTDGLVTGMFRAMRTTDLATTVDTLNISGLVINTDQLETIETSGAQYLAAISGNTARYAAVSSSTISGSMATMTTGLGLVANASRKEAYCQVIGSGGPLYLAFNANGAGVSNFNVILKAATTDIGTDGGVWSSQLYTGPVAVSGGIGCRFNIWQSA